jgi:hypothetical protein
LFAIGHTSVFSLGGSLPAALGLHSQAARLAEPDGLARAAPPHGAITLLGDPFQGTRVEPHTPTPGSKPQRMLILPGLSSARFTRRY